MGARDIDWQRLHQRLASAKAAIAGETAHSPEHVLRVLKERAKEAAKRPVSTVEGERVDVLAFWLVGERYGVETGYVREVCQLKHLTAVPCTPPHVAGVVSLRGEVIAIVDLRKLFDLPAGGLTELNRVVVLSDGANELGLLADSIDGVCSVAREALQRGLPTLTGIREKLLVGVTGEMLAVLDAQQLLGDASLKVEEHVGR